MSNKINDTIYDEIKEHLDTIHWDENKECHVFLDEDENGGEKKCVPSEWEMFIRNNKLL